jgi:hypothetical protein
MVDPWAVLERLVSLQPQGAVFILSVPNIAHAWVRLNLLIGRFRYAERGILDSTHLRFFTGESFRNCIVDAGLQINDFTVSPVPLTLLSPFFSNSGIGRSLTEVFHWFTLRFPLLMGYQLIARAIK